MRYRVSNIPLWLDEDDALLVRRAAERLGVSRASLSDALVVRRSLDARKKGNPRWLVNLEVAVEGEVHGAPADVAPVSAPEPAPSRPPRARGAARSSSAPGPAGLFCAWALLERGVPSIVRRPRQAGRPAAARRRRADARRARSTPSRT